jgi:hypothetical protein
LRVYESDFGVERIIENDYEIRGALKVSVEVRLKAVESNVIKGELDIWGDTVKWERTEEAEIDVVTQHAPAKIDSDIFRRSNPSDDACLERDCAIRTTRFESDRTISDNEIDIRNGLDRFGFFAIPPRLQTFDDRAIEKKLWRDEFHAFDSRIEIVPEYGEKRYMDPYALNSNLAGKTW